MTYSTELTPAVKYSRFDQAVCVPADDGYLYARARILLDMVKPAPEFYTALRGRLCRRSGRRGIKRISKWCDVTNNSYQATELWGDIIISDGALPYRKRGNTVKNEDKTPQTGNYVRDSL